MLAIISPPKAAVTCDATVEGTEGDGPTEGDGGGGGRSCCCSPRGCRNWNDHSLQREV